MSDFDLASAQPVAFDLASAKPVGHFGSGQSLDVTADGQTVPSASPEATAARSPVAGNNFLQNALVGSGKYFTDLGLGVRQIYGRAADDVTAPSWSTLVKGGDRTKALEQEAAQKRQTDAPVMGTVGGKVGQIGTGVLATLPLSAIPGAGTYVGAAAIGAGLGALQPVTSNESRLLNTGVGAGMGVAGKFVGDKVGNWLANRKGSLPPPNLTDAEQQALSRGQALGMQATPGQATGSKTLQQLEAKLESQPWTSGPANAIKQGNQTVLNRAAAKSIGETADVVDSTVLDQAATRLGKVFDSVRTPNSIVAIDPKTASSAIDSIDQDAEGLISGSIRDNPLVKRFATLADSGGANGEQLGSLSSKLGRAAYKQMTGPSGDRDMGQALYAVKDQVDDLLESSLSGAQKAEYAAAREQYRNLMTLTSRTNIVNPSSGNVAGVALASKLQQADKSGFLYGRKQSDLYDATHFAQAFKPIVGNSGTATRSLDMRDIVTAPVGIPANIGSRLYFSRFGQSVAPALLHPSQAAQNMLAASARGTAPLLQNLPPGVGGVLTPYLTQQ